MKKQIPIFFAVDDNYVPQLKVALSSLMEHASKDYNYIIYILNIQLLLQQEKNMIMIMTEEIHYIIMIYQNQKAMILI
mgnify:CR=1 FL=1